MESGRLKSAGLSIGIHVLILFILTLLYISTPIPPFEEGLAGGGGGGSFVEFGTLDVEEAPVVNTPPPPQQEAESEILTSDIEETVTIDEPPKKKDTPPEKKPVVPKTNPKPEPPKVVKTPVELPKVEDRKPDQNSMYPPKKGGNAGNPGGTANGTGTGGQGTGNGGGNGSGTGPGSGGGSGNGSGGGNGDGTGLYFDLGGRSMRSRPRIEESSQETGKVIIDIVVDKDGNVTTVNGPARGSTTSAPVLVAKAKQAAREAKFSKSPNGVEEQKGTITFVFKFE